MKGFCSKCNKTTIVLKHSEKCKKCHSFLIFRCRKCDFENASQETVRMHEKHHNEDDCKCPGCGKGFASNSNVKKHKRICKSLASPSEGKLDPTNLLWCAIIQISVWCKIIIRLLKYLQSKFSITGRLRKCYNPYAIWND